MYSATALWARGRGRSWKARLLLRPYKLFRRDAQSSCELPAYGAALRLYLIAFDANDGRNAHAGFVGEFLLSQEGCLRRSLSLSPMYSTSVSIAVKLLRSRRLLTELYHKSFVNGRFMVYMRV